MRFGTVNIDTHDGRHFFRVQVFPGSLNPDQFKVELYAESVPEGAAVLYIYDSQCKSLREIRWPASLFGRSKRDWSRD